MFIPATYELFDTDGNGFSITRAADGSCLVTVYDDSPLLLERELPVVWETPYRDEVWHFLDYWLSAARAVRDDAQAGLVREALQCDYYFDGAQGLSLGVDPGDCADDKFVTVEFFAADMVWPGNHIEIDVTVTKEEFWASVQEMDEHYPNF